MEEEGCSLWLCFPATWWLAAEIVHEQDVWTNNAVFSSHMAEDDGDFLWFFRPHGGR
ncbi:hypothetical protein CTI12_AA305480 [Artemisia annua]|uniref:Uncharacterized protein n=1 Tax=Artemisia annua TaxID=35608 RepID=A0A2U1LXU8_ARTAN|nr:hypothetical protein CTI12_AA305480 [Artemisia annua]